MIKASFRKDSENRITDFVITGHADYSEYGQDIVCAAVSVTVIGTINNLETLAKTKANVDMDNENGGYIKFNVNYDKSSQQNHDIALLLDNLYYTYKDIVKEYSEFAGYAN